MTFCKFDIDNFEYNIESNLAAMGLPLPKTIFGAGTSIATGLASIDSALAGGPKARLASVSKAGTASKQVLALGAAGYAGAVIGSYIMAANRATRCNREELKKAASDLGLSNWWVDDAVNENDEILRKH